MKSKSNSNVNMVAILVVVAVILVIGSFLVIQNVLTGKTIDSGDVDVTVLTSAAINFTTSAIDFGSGSVTTGETIETLWSHNGSAYNGNWSFSDQAFVIENVGNVNVSLDLKTGKTAATLLGGTSPEYKYMWQNVEAGSCTGGNTEKDWYTVDNEGTGDQLCGILNVDDAIDTINVSVYLGIPYNSFKGPLSDTFTATIAEA